MPSHFSSIGFPVSTSQELGELAERVSRSASRVKTKNGAYLRWSCASGPELWLQVNRGNELVGLMPHFSGQSLTRVGLISRFVRLDSTEFEGAFHGWADPKNDKPDSGEYPFVFDCPDYVCTEGLALPRIVNVQIAAFAHELSVYESDEAFGSSQSEGVQFASESFIPSGLFSPKGETTSPAQAAAIFTGHVLATEERTNPMTGHGFFSARVKTLGGVFDVVADRTLITRKVAPGYILSGSFWLSGRIRPTHARGTGSFFGKLLERFSRP